MTISPDLDRGWQSCLGRFVVTRHGRLGLLSRVEESSATGVRRCVVQFGADGPVEWFKPPNLCWATRQEVDDAGLLGVGHVQVYAPPPLSSARRKRRSKIVSLHH